MSDPYSDVILDIVEGRLAELRAVIPGKVDKTHSIGDRARTVDFDPGIGRKMDGEDVADGTVQAAPVLYPAGGGYWEVWPLDSGDEVVGLAADRNPDRWRADRVVGPAHARLRPHDASNSFILPAAITAPEGAPDDPGTAWVSGGPAGEAIRIDLDVGELTLTKSGTPVATLTMSEDGSITLTPAAGESVNAGGTDALALGQAVIDSVDAMLAGGVPVAQDGGVALLSTMVTAWNLIKATILALITKGA